METYIFGAGLYILGTLLGYLFAWHRANDKVASRTIDWLEREGYLRTKRIGDEIEFLKINE
jgi:hypothetical protein